MKAKPNKPCLCGSGVKFKRCCGPVIGGKKIPSPEALMRSRFCAYALGDATYIIETTYKNGPRWEEDRAAWRQSILSFATANQFEGVDILKEETNDSNQNEYYVTFKARLNQGSKDVSFIERSRFVRREGRWFYYDGKAPGQGLFGRG